MPPAPLPSPGFGTYRLTDAAQTPREVASALEAGYRHLDTAQMYDNEALVGEGLARADVPREEVLVATKVAPENLAPEDVRASTEASLDRLDLDVIDLLYVHWPSGTYDASGTLSAFDDLVDDGLVRHVGLSNFTPDLLDEARDALDAPVFAHQVEMHPLLQQGDLRRYAVEHDHYLVAYAPLARTEVMDVPVLQEIGERYDLTPAQVSLAWLASKEHVVPIPKASGDHVTENLAAFDVDLDPDDVAQIDAIDEQRRLIDPDGAPWN